MSIFNSSIIAHEQCIPCVARAQDASYTQNFSRHNMLYALVCKLGCELYRISAVTGSDRLRSHDIPN